MSYCRETIERFYNEIRGVNPCREIRLFKASIDSGGIIRPETRWNSAVAGWFDDGNMIVNAMVGVMGASAYITPNPVREDLLARVRNRVARLEKGHGTTDADIVAVEWLYVDIDARRPVGVSSTESELAAAIEVRDQILADHPEIKAAALWGCSGNGGWILARIKRLETASAPDLTRPALHSLAAAYSNDRAAVDTTTFNASRVMCLPGTLKCKGESIETRPHRMTTLDSPAGRDLTPMDLAAWVAEHPAPEPERKAVAPAKLPSKGGADPIERARAYLVKLAPAISGQGGHNQTFDAACALVKGFGLTPDQALPLLAEYNERCDPPWEDFELRHKLDDASARPSSRPNGYLLAGRPFTPTFPVAPPPPGEAAQAGADEQGNDDIIPYGLESDPDRLAQIVLAGYTHPLGSRLRYWNEDFYGWNGRSYEVIDKEVFDGIVSDAVEAEFTRIHNLKIAVYQEELLSAKEGITPKMPIKQPTSSRAVADVVKRIKAIAGRNMSGIKHVPAWIPPYDGPDAEGIIPAANALIDLRRLIDGEDYAMPHTPNFFCLHSVSYEVSPNLPEPENWLRVLDGQWGRDSEQAKALEEWMGLFLTSDIRFQKFLFLVGPPRSGKSTIHQVIERLVGKENYMTMDLDNFTETHGIAPLLGKTVVVLPDAHSCDKKTAGKAVGKLKQIIGRDDQQINQKFKRVFKTKLKARFLVTANQALELPDPSGALADRMIVIKTVNSFRGREDITLDEKLEAETPAIFLRAAKALKRLYDRGKFIQPSEDSGIVRRIRNSISFIGGFVDEKCDVGSDHWVRLDEAYEACKMYREQGGMEGRYTKQRFENDLESYVPGYRSTRPRGGEKREWWCVGLKLNDETEEELSRWRLRRDGVLPSSAFDSFDR